MPGSRPDSFALSAPGQLRLYSTAELLRMPPPLWLMTSILPARGFVGLYAPPESFKSFVAIDWTMSVGAGLPWLGHDVEPGFAVYVGAEGGGGVAKRAKAWLQVHQKEPKDVDVAWVMESLPIYNGSEELEVLINRLQNEIDRRPQLIVIDTLARCFDGDENQQEDMGRFVGGIGHLQRQFQATVVVVHHTNLGGSRERGNTALRGATDTMVELGRAGAEDKPPYTGYAKCTKQKDAEHFEDIQFQVAYVSEADSCAVVPSAKLLKRESEVEQLVQVLQPLGTTDWNEMLTTLEGRGLRDLFYKRVGELKATGRLKKVGTGKWRAQ